jgi:signal peptidase
MDDRSTGNPRQRATLPPRRLKRVVTESQVMTADDEPDPRAGPRAALRWFLGTDDGTVVFVRELLSSVLAVALVGALLFAISGVWPPMVAVESGSMEPHMERGDLIFLVDEDRFVPAPAYEDTGVVTYRDARSTDYRKFGDYGDVIIYRQPGRTAPPIIHRTRFWVGEGENWFQRADDRYVQANNCEEMRNCPAPHAGFITKGDRNPYYDQSQGIAPPVKPAWIRGTAEIKVPWLGWVRLTFSGMNSGLAGMGDLPADPPGAGGTLGPVGTTSAPDPTPRNELRVASG